MWPMMDCRGLSEDLHTKWRWARLRRHSSSCGQFIGKCSGGLAEIAGRMLPPPPPADIENSSKALPAPPLVHRKKKYFPHDQKTHWQISLLPCVRCGRIAPIGGRDYAGHRKTASISAGNSEGWPRLRELVFARRDHTHQRRGGNWKCGIIGKQRKKRICYPFFRIYKFFLLLNWCDELMLALPRVMFPKCLRNVTRFLDRFFFRAEQDWNEISISN